MIESPLVDSGFVVPVFSPRDDPIACLNNAMAFLTAVASSRFPSTNNQLRTSSNLRNQATIQDGRVTVQQVQGRQGQSYSGTGYKSNATIFRGNNASRLARVVKCYNCQAQEARQILDEEQFAFLADPGVPDGQAVQIIILNNAAFQTEDLDTHDSDCDDISNAKAVLMANISNYGSNVISDVPYFETYLDEMENQSVHAMHDFEQTLVVDVTDNEITSDSNIIPYSQYFQETQQENVQDTNLQAQQDSVILSVIEQMSEQMINHVNNWEKANKEQNNESVTVKLERYKERVKTFKQCLNIDLSSREKMIDSQMDDMIKEKLALKEQVESLKQNLSKQIKEKESLLQTLSKDFRKRLTPQQELSAEQAFWLRISNPTIEFSNIPPVKVEVPSELPKVSLVNARLKKLKFHLAQFDSMVKKRIPHDARTEVMNYMSLIGESVNMERKRNDSCDKCFNLDDELLKSQNAHNDLLKSYSQPEKHCISLELSIQLNQEIFQKYESYDNQNAFEILEYFKNNDLKAQLQDKDTTICKLKEIIKSIREKSKEENVNYDYCEIETKNMELENSVAKLLSENEHLCKEINHVKQDLKAQIQDKVFMITSWKNDLRKVKGKEIIDIASQIPSANTIVLRMFKLDLDPLAPRLLQNREAHIDYLKYTQEQVDILRGIVAVTPKNNVKKVRFAEPLTSSSNIKQVESSKTSDSNTLVLSPTGLKCSTSNCGSKPTGNKRNYRISQTPSRNMKNKVEAQPRKVNKKNYVVEHICDVNVKHSLHAKSAKKHKKQNIWKPTGHVFTGVGLKWKPTGRTFTIVGCPDCSLVLDSGCSKHMTGNCSQLMNFVSKFLGTVSFGNDHIARIMGYDDYQLGNVTISRVYYVEGLGLSKTKSWLWHRRLSHLNFGTLNKLAKDGLARGIPRLQFQKDHLCSACALGKSKKSSHQPKAEDTNQKKLYLLHMDLCGPMRVASINGKTYILVIVEDYSRFTWVKFLRSKDESPEAIIKCIKNIQVRLNATVRNVQTDNGTEFVNLTLREFYENVGISHQTSVARSPQQNGVVERQNRTLVEAARTMLIFSKASLFLWAEAINTACYTQNRSLIRIRYNKTPYELMQDKKPDLSFFHVFGALCYPTNDNDDLCKLDAKADIGIFVGYAPAKKAFRIYNKIIWKIIETIHVTFDELTPMASEQFNSGLGLHMMTPDDWDQLLQHMFDEYFNPPLIVVSLVQEDAAPRAVVLADSPMSTSIDQDAPSTNDWDQLLQHMFDEYFNPPLIVVSLVQEDAAPRAVVLADSPMSTSIDQDAPSTSIPSTQE
ncbi:retrovirus-related pol polyprotein from transposon TNT 1-94 [Tanacetum coccineum]|uniref:Retrovirus-related pol polyprotein from transposon TNT 1-94 n=1 Tax=Tanacetum coccineum TaxID=301880 RepID=A0ABQ4Y378_9ASTR